MSKKNGTDSDKKSDVCFACNISVLLFLIVVGVVIMHILGLELSTAIFISFFLLIPYAFLEERFISKYVNMSVEWVYKTFFNGKNKKS